RKGHDRARPARAMRRVRGHRPRAHAGHAAADRGGARFPSLAMKTGLADADEAQSAAIVAIVGDVSERVNGRGEAALALLEHEQEVLAQARAFAEPLLRGRRFDTGEDALDHADGVAQILRGIGAAPSMRAAAYLVYAGEYLTRPEDVIAKAYGESYASVVAHTLKLVRIQRSARDALADDTGDSAQRAEQIERVRKMLLAFSRDLRVVLLRLASRLQTLRYYAASKQGCPRAMAQESMQVFAPLANRLGIWPVKWEIEDLAFRFLQPDDY